MFDESLLTGSNSFANSSNPFNFNEINGIEPSDLITPNPSFNKVSLVGDSSIDLENYRLTTQQNFNLFASQSFEQQPSKDFLTGKTVGNTLVEPDDNTLSTARNLGGLLNNAQTFNDSISSTDTNDYYRFSLTSKSNFNLALNGLSDDANVQLLDRNGKTIQTSNKTGTTAESISRMLNAGDYYIRVYPNGSISSNYTLNTNAAIADVAGNTLTTANNFGTLNGNKKVTDYVGSIDTNDYYRFSVSDRSSLNLIVNGMSANADVQFLDSNGNVLQSATNTGTTAESISRTLDAGTYYVRVFPVNGVNTNYTLDLTARLMDNAGNTLDGARNVGSLSGTRTFNDAVNTTDTNDYYRFNLTNNSNFSLTLNGLGADANVQLLDSTGNVLRSSNNTGKTAESISATLNTGNYFVRVFPNGSISTNYQISMTANAVPVDGAGNSISTARILGNLVDATQTISDAIGNGDSDDYYRFSLLNNSNFSLSLNGLSNDADIKLLDSKGNFIKSSVNGGSNAESISATLNAGDYFVHVFPYGSITTNYNLSLTATSIIAPSPDPITAQWYQANIFDVEIRDLTQNLAVDNSLNRNDMISIFRVAKDGSLISADELKDLRTLVANANGFGMQDFVRVLSDKVANGSVANQKSGINNLFAGSSDTQMESLIGKWFLGSDRPTTLSTSHTYRQVSGSLFQNGISADDVKQGQLGDCYYLSTLSSIAQEKSSFIQDMFIDNGDNTFTVRFFNNNVADYVTVDRWLPTDSNGRLVYASAGASATNSSNELWVALAEKAYAQLAELGWSRNIDSTDAYGAIEGGWMSDAMEQLTGLSTSERFLTNETTTPAMTKQELIDLVNSNKLLTAGFVNGSKYGVVNEHAYTITSYNASSDTFFLRNPWATSHVSLTMAQLMDVKTYIQWSNV
jgi:Calpain family cysteine protease/Bacterial pre-peptidase C-terminal domain